jgi:hypothetical protein
MPKRKKTVKGALFRVEQFGLMVNAYLGKAGLKRTRGERKIAKSMEKLEELYADAEEDRRGFAAELRKGGDETGAAMLENGMEREGWQKFWTRERIEAYRKAMKKR